MSLWPDQRCLAMRAALMLGLLVMVAMPVWAGEKQSVMIGKERTAWIQEFQRERARVEVELGQLLSQPEGTARSRFRGLNSPTTDEKHERIPGVRAKG